MVGGERVSGMDTEEYIYTSIIKPDAFVVSSSTGTMPNNLARGLSPSQIMDLTAFLCKQGGKVRPARLLALEASHRSQPPPTETLTFDLGSLERGKELFVGRLGCVECHSLSGLPGADLKAPSLLQVGANSRERLKKLIVDPGPPTHPAYEVCTVALRDGTLVSGRRLPSPNGGKTILVFDEAGGAVSRSFTEDELEPETDSSASPGTRRASPMPAYGNSMTSRELEDLLDFLSTLQ
jgi:hypothetical protein